jgi:hypothetical protein
MQRWRREWEAIAGRIAGLQATAAMVIEAASVHGLSHESICSSALKPTLLEVLHALKAFAGVHQELLPTAAAACLRRGLDQVEKIKGDFTSWQSAIAVTAVVMGLNAEVSATLLDVEAAGRDRTECAFEHLSRSIVVDADFRERWQAAFREGEVRCEQRGALHLLQHNIWAFKVDAHGERTDLVLQERLDIDRKVEAAQALVLTEWKLAKEPGDVEGAAVAGRRQAAIYGASSLAAIELASIRYIVIVTERRAAMPADIVEGLVTYRFINLAVAPESPSAEARRG